MNIKESGCVVKGKLGKAEKDKKKLLVDAILLELGRYISCGTTNHDREKAYPRQLFETRIKKVIDEVYSLKASY